MEGSSSHAQNFDLPATVVAVNFSQPIQPRNCKFVVEPDLKDEHALIWKSQVLFPSTSTHAFLGPFPTSQIDNDAVKSIFPSYHKYSPRVFE